LQGSSRFILGAAISIEVWLICKYKKYGTRPGDTFSWREVGQKTKASFWALMMPVLIMGHLYRDLHRD